MATKLNGKDTISAKLATATAVIHGNRYNLFNIIDFEATLDKNVTEVPVLGKSGVTHKSISWNGSFSGSMYYTTSMFREMLKKFADTGEDTYFTITLTNEDPTSATGKQTVVLLNCLLSGGTLAKFDGSADDVVTEDIEGTFDDFEIKDSFTQLAGFQE